MNKTETQVIEDLLRQMGRMGLLDTALTDHDLDVLLNKVNPDGVSINFKQRALNAMREAQAKRAKAAADAGEEAREG